MRRICAWTRVKRVVVAALGVSAAWAGVGSVPASAQPCITARWEAPTPDPSLDVDAVYDSARGVTVLFGGRLASALPGSPSTSAAETWEWNGTAWRRAAVSGPSPRISFAMTYDRGRGVAVLFGGLTGTTRLGDTWEWDGTSWSLRSTTGPSPRSGHAMFYDETMSRTVLFGGHDGVSPLSDTWMWTGAAWARVEVTGPSPRHGHAVAFDSSRGEAMLHGGADAAAAYLGDTWKWRDGQWTLLTAAGPRRVFPKMIYDAARDRMVLTDGIPVQGSGDYTATWEWNGSAWEPRYEFRQFYSNFGLVFDEQRARPTVFSTWGLMTVNDWDGAAWSVLSRGSPLGRTMHGMVYDGARDRMMVIGGMVWRLFTEERLWMNSPASDWLATDTPGAGAWARPAVAYDSGRGVTVVVVKTSEGDQTWEWDGAMWQLKGPSPAGTSPALFIAYDANRQRTVMFRRSLRDTWEWDGAAWTRVATASGPSSVWPQAMAYDAARHATVLFAAMSGRTAETWEWDGAAWTRRATGGPASRENPALAYDPRLGGVVLFGGETPGADPEDTWLWNGTAWVQVLATGPAGRYNHAMAYDAERQRLVLVDGEAPTASTALGDTWELVVYDALAFASEPNGRSARVGDALSLSAEISGGETLVYQWKRDGEPVVDEGRVSGSRTATLTIAPARSEDAGSYTLDVSNACGSITSGAAQVRMICRGDLDGDGVVDFTDYLAFLDLFDAGDPAADLNRDGVVDFADYLEFLNFFGGLC